MWESPPIAASLWQERAQSTERKGHRLRPCPWIIVRGSAKSLLQPAPNGPNQPEGCAQQRGEAGPTGWTHGNGGCHETRIAFYGTGRSVKRGQDAL